MLIHCPDVDGKRAPDADDFLTSRGYILRAVKGYGLPNALRLSVGTEEANRLVVAALRDLSRTEGSTLFAVLVFAQILPDFFLEPWRI